MIEYVAVDYGDNKLELKSRIGEFVRRMYRVGSPRNPDRFVDLKFKIKDNTDSDHTAKYKLTVWLYHMEVKDSKYKVRQNKRKYKKAVLYDYLNWFERRKLYGKNPPIRAKEVKL